MNWEQEFLKRIAILARMSGMEMMPEIVTIYDVQLAPYGYERVTRAMDQIISTRDTRDPFPALNDIRRALGVPVAVRVDPKDEEQNEADRIVDQIFSAMRKFGQQIHPDRREEFREYIGTAADKLLSTYSWYDLCDLPPDQISYWRTLMKRSAVAMLRAAKTGQIDRPPQLPTPEKHSGLLQEAMDVAEKGIAIVK